MLRPVAPIQVRNADTEPRTHCLHDVAAAAVDPDVTDTALGGIDEEDDVAGPQVGGIRDHRPVPRAILPRRAMRQSQAELVVDVAREPAAVEGIRASSTPGIARADELGREPYHA